VNNESIFDQSSESAVLSCFLHAQLDEQREMLSTLREDHFHLYEHKLIFQSFLRVVGKSIHADYISIKSDLDANGQIENIGGDKTLAEIAS
jgi:replicative DNA helicase